MGARNSQHVAPLQDMFGEPLWAARVGQACVQNGFHQREFRRTIVQTSATDHIANHEHVRFHSQLVGTEAFNQVNAQGAQLVAHGRVHAGVATGDFVPGLTRQCRQAAHEGAANTKYVNVHGRHFRVTYW